MKMIILNLLLLKFSASFIAASRCRPVRSSLQNQLYFTKVPGRGKCHILLRKILRILSFPPACIPETILHFV